MSAEDNQYVEQQPGGEGKTRLDLLKTAGVVAGAAVAAKLVSPDSASAAHGGDVVIGVDNTEQDGHTTSLSTGAGTAGADGAPAFSVAAPNFDYGVKGEGQNFGVWGTGPGGVVGTGGAVGGTFSGNTCALGLVPQAGAGAPTGEAFKGDVAVDSGGVMWLCIAEGTPGTWIRVSHGGSRFLATPQRAYDTRAGSPPATGPKTKLTVGTGSTATPRPVTIGGLFGVPSNALGIFGTLSIVVPDALIFASLWPQGAFPGTANILANPGAFISTAFSVGLNPADGTILIGASGATDAIIDVAGYVL